jgi:hypothetical protein
LLPDKGKLLKGDDMTENHTKSRQTAEIAFAKTQSQFLARGRALDEQDAIASARDEKTLRLREARLTREREARESATAALVAKRART